jgi:glycosyltransferase involved in cell wall biosynthesis
MNTDRRCLVIVPAYNEADALPGALAALREARPDLDVLVVDDGSSDATATVARRCGATVLRLPYNLGIGGALRTGFRYAVDHGYGAAVQYDGDGQHDPRDIAALVDAVDRGADLAIGSRFAGRDSAYEVGRARGGAMGLLRLLVRLLTGKRFTDTSSGFRAFSRPMLQFFSRHYPVEYMESVEALILADGAGYRVTEVPVRMSSRAKGVPSTRSLRLVYHFLRVLVVMVVSKGALPRTVEEAT